jgi:pSer/pThr/pTyr-binding forkhead associated (FHA) protein
MASYAASVMAPSDDEDMNDANISVFVPSDDEDSHVSKHVTFDKKHRYDNEVGAAFDHEDGNDGQDDSSYDSGGYYADSEIVRPSIAKEDYGSKQSASWIMKLEAEHDLHVSPHEHGVYFGPSLRRFHKGFERVRIGRRGKVLREPDFIEFDSEELSRLHCEIWLREGKLYIRDTKSTRGTYLNGKRLSKTGRSSEPHELNNFDVLWLGKKGQPRRALRQEG